MKHLHAVVALSAIAATAIFATATMIAAAPRSETGMTRSDEVSSAKRYYHRRYAYRHHAPGYVYEPRYHRGFNDPSIAPNGRPYRVPEYLRNQCYIDEGYGRFSACPNR
jgi:hypothetical protein